MRFLRTTGILFVFLISFVVCQAQGVVDDISGSIRIGNVNGISRYFDNAVAMSIAGSHSTYSRSQAEMILRDFFNKNTPKGFSIDQAGDNNQSKFAIGTLHTSNGNFRAYFLLKPKAGGYVIQEFRFEK